jgi:hypothetical protein
LKLDDGGASFFQRALKMRGDRAPKRPKVSLESLEALLTTSGKLFDLITIHREKIDPEICQIGRFVEIADGRLVLHEIGPRADWDEVFESYRIKEITQVNFGGGYERALALVSGPAPEVRSGP